MYTTIIKGTDGKFHCAGRLQDSTERWTEDTLEAAVKSIISFAWTGNHDKITRKQITFLKPKEVVKTEYVPWTPPKKRRAER